MTGLDPGVLDPGVLDTVPFAGRSLAEINAWATASRPGVRLLPTATGQVRVRVRGRGPATVVVLPDAPNTIEHYDDLVDRLAPELRVVALEIPGFGFSWATDPAALHFDGTVAATAEALRQLDLGDGATVLTGVCVHAYVALAVAARHPDLADALVLLQAPDWAGAAHWGGAALDPRGALARPWEGQAGWRLTRERAAVDWWYPAAAAAGRDVTGWQATAREVLAAGASYSLATLSQAWFGGEPPDLSGAEQPTTVVWGAADRTHARAGSDPRGLLRHVPHARWVEWPEAGHFADVEAPERFCDEVRRAVGLS